MQPIIYITEHTTDPLRHNKCKEDYSKIGRYYDLMKQASVNCAVSGCERCVGCKNTFGALYDKYNGNGDQDLCEECNLNE